MIFQNIELKYFKATEYFYLDFTSPGLTLLVGPNGAGKTTVADAICYALLNRSVTGLRPKQLLSRTYSEPLEVVLNVKIDEQHQYRIVRRLTQKGVASLSIFKNGATEPLAFEHTNSANAFLKQICSKDLFFNAVFFAKSSGTFFLEMSDTQRKKFLEKLLGLEVFEIGEKVIEQRFSALQVQLHGTTREFEMFSQFSETREKDLQELLRTTTLEDNNLKLERSSFESTIETLTSWLQEAEKQTLEIQRLQQLVTTQQTNYQQLTLDIEKAEAALQEEVLQLRQFLMTKLQKYTQHSQQLQEKLSSYQLNAEKEKNALQQTLKQTYDDICLKLRTTSETELRQKQLAETTSQQQQLEEYQREVQTLKEKHQQLEASCRETLQAFDSTYKQKLTSLDKKLQLCQTELQKSRSEAKKASISFARLDSAGKQLIREREQLAQAIASGVCPTCHRSGMVSDEIKQHALQIDTKLQAIVAELRELEAAETRASEEEERLAASVESYNEQRLALDKEYREQRSVLEAKNTETLKASTKQIELKQEACQKITTQISASVEKLRQQFATALQEQLAKAEQEYKTSLHKKLESLQEKTAQQLKSLTEESQVAVKQAHDFQESIESLIENDPKRLRKLKAVITLQEQQKRCYDTLLLQQEQLRKLEAVYGTEIVAQKKELLAETIRLNNNVIQQLKKNQQKRDTAQQTFANWKKTELRRLEDEKNTLEKQEQLLEFWKKAFSSKGIRLQILEQAFPEINRQLQIKAEQISGGNFSISLERSGDKLSFSAQNLETGSDYPMFSSGEKSLCALIFLLSIADVLASFAMFTTNLSIFDEIFDSLDFFNSNVVFEALQALSKDKHILLATHNELYKEADNVTAVIEPHRM